MIRCSLPILVAVTCLLAAPCTSMASDAGQFVRDASLEFEGIARSYHLYIPDQSDATPMPVVFLLHGYGGNADLLLGLSGRKAPYRVWLSIADREKLVLVIPNGMVKTKRKQSWNDARGLAENSAADDVSFFAELVDVVAGSYPVDRGRVYAMGTSNGGHMALRLASEATNTFAAVAAVVASNPSTGFRSAPAEPISVLFMNGTEDRFLPYNGGPMSSERGIVSSAEQSFDYWSEHNQCEEYSPFQAVPHQTRNKDSTVFRKSCSNHATNTEVVLYKIEGGGHTEPSMEEQYSWLATRFLGRQNHDIEAAEEVWRFFEDKSN